MRRIDPTTKHFDRLLGTLENRIETRKTVITMAPKQENNVTPEQATTTTTTTTTAVYDHLPADIDTYRGLSTAQVQALHNQWGNNTIPAPKVPAYLIFIRQFTGFLPLLIAAAAFVSLAVEGTYVRTCCRDAGYMIRWETKKSTKARSSQARVFLCL